jgi:hypothetical protein
MSGDVFQMIVEELMLLDNLGDHYFLILTVVVKKLPYFLKT